MPAWADPTTCTCKMVKNTLKCRCQVTIATTIQWDIHVFDSNTLLNNGACPRFFAKWLSDHKISSEIKCMQGFIWAKYFEGETGGRAGLMDHHRRGGYIWKVCGLIHGVQKLKCTTCMSCILMSEFSKSHATWQYLRRPDSSVCTQYTQGPNAKEL